MNFVLSKAIFFLFVWQHCHATDFEKRCINLSVTPQARHVFNYSHTYDIYLSDKHTSDIRHYLFNSYGNAIVSSNKNSSLICYNPHNECHYLFLTGHGDFEITATDSGDTSIIEEGELVYGSPKLIRMGDCVHHCSESNHQLVFVGETSDEPGLYSLENNHKSVVEGVVFDEMTDENHEEFIMNYTIDLDDKNQSVIMRTMCLQPTKCYELIGSSMYILSTNESHIVEEGTTYDGFKMIGPAKQCHQRCLEKPLLVETKRGQEITMVLSTISGMASLTDVNSPQYLAACWLIHDDERQLQPSDINNAHVIQRYILALLFYTLGGSDWTRNYDFLTFKHECEWRKSVFNNYYYGTFFSGGSGVQCHDSGYVSAIILVKNNLVGSIPTEFTWLHHIEFVDLSVNSIYETIPSQIGNLRNLRQLRISGNQLTGSIPQGLGEIESLEVMDLAVNMLDGSMISNAGGNLVHVNLRHNAITGTIPNNIGTHTSLVYLGLYENLLTGTMPDSITDLKSLEYLILEGNGISGTLPSQIFTMPSLYFLALSNFGISGKIPSNVTNESVLRTVDLDGNKLTGTIPPELAHLPNLELLRLQNNALTGKIPSNLTMLENKLKDFRFHNNDITGVVPFENCYIPKLEADCDSPRKASCACCTRCHSAFPTRDGELACPSSAELKVVFEEVEPGGWIRIELLAADGQVVDSEIILPKGISHTYHKCVSLSSCYTIYFPEPLSRYPFAMSVFVDEIFVTEEFVTEHNSAYHFGYSAGLGIQKDTCDAFELCNFVAQGNSTRRGLVDKLTRITGIDVLENITSPYYKAACFWVDYVGGKSDDDLKHSSLLQYYFLVFIYFATNGENWISSDLWLTNESYCSWHGVLCDGYDIVTSLNLTANNLLGTLPTEIGILRGLQHLILSNNNLTGSLPTEIAELTNLESLQISNNSFFGGLPSEMGVGLKKLNRLQASNNIITGSLPFEITHLKDLVEVNLSYNQLADSIPTDIGRLGKLEILDLSSNVFQGELPNSFFELTSMKVLCLGSNLLAGNTANVERFLDLEVLDLSANFFTGSMPLGAHQNKLRSLKVSRNRFIGSIPLSIEQMRSLEELLLYDNQLTGNIPSQLGNLGNLTQASFSFNRFKGTVPTAIGKLRNLTLLHLHHNELEGNSDHFDYFVGDYIADCGNTLTSQARVRCDNCTSCCNSNGDCLSKSVAWPGEMVQVSKLSPEAFVFIMALASSGFVLVIIAIVSWNFEGKADFSFCEEFQEQSIYRFFLNDSLVAKLIAGATVALQVLLLYIFIEASDFTSIRSDWEYSLDCPKDNIECESRRHVTGLAWVAFGCVLFAYLTKDMIESVKMMYLGVISKSWKGGFAGFVVLFITITSIVASVLYNYSTGLSNTDILKDAVILLFLNHIDEQLYSLVRLLRPSWVAERNETIRNYLVLQRRQTMIGRSNSGVELFCSSDGGENRNPDPRTGTCNVQEVEQNEGMEEVRDEFEFEPKSLEDQLKIAASTPHSTHYSELICETEDQDQNPGPCKSTPYVQEDPRPLSNHSVGGIGMTAHSDGDRVPSTETGTFHSQPLSCDERDILEREVRTLKVDHEKLQRELVEMKNKQVEVINTYEKELCALKAGYTNLQKEFGSLKKALKSEE